MQIYQVGGSVRDKLMHRTPHDIDYVVVGADIAQMQKLGFRQVGKNFPVFINPHDGCEYALARREIKTGPRHADFQFVFTPDITLEDDLERRDFTCNALAMDNNGLIIDLHRGIDDIKNKILRHVNAEHFIEDPLRVLRLCRFAAQLDFEPAAETMQLASSMVKSGQLAYLSVERIWQEIFKALQTSHFDKFITTLRQCGALEIILPEVEQLFATPERPDFHPEGNSGAHTLLCLQQVADASPKIKLAVLLHDIGKTLTPKKILPSHHGHAEAGAPLVKRICRRLKVSKEFTYFAALSCLNHMKLHLVRQMRLSTLVDFVDGLTAKKTSYLEDFITVCRADFFGRGLIIPSEITELEADIAYLRQAAAILNRIKATDMPDFALLAKDQTFNDRFRNYKIKILSRAFQKHQA